MSTPQFWMAMFVGFGAGICMMTINIHIVPYATDLGFSAVSAAAILSAMGVASILGGIMLGGFADRIGNRQTLIFCFILTAITLFLLVPARELWMLYVLAFLLRFSVTGGATLQSPIVAELFGMRSHGLIFGVMSLGYIIGSSVGPFMGGYIFDTTGSYYIAFLICGTVGVFSFISASMLRPIRTRN